MTTEPQEGYPEQSQAVTVLVIGILSIVPCALLGPFAWKMGNTELQAIAEGRRSPEGQGMAEAGRICGIIGTVLLGIEILVALGLLFLIPVGIITTSELGGIDFTP